MNKIKLGFAPTRRSIFSAPVAIKYADLTRERLGELDVSFVDIKDINEEGLLYNEADRIKIAEKFKAEKVDGLFFPHGNFGTEYEVARLAKELMFRCFYGDPGMSARMRTASVSVTASAGFLPQARF